jgi:hypothetical protein
VAGAAPRPYHQRVTAHPLPARRHALDWGHLRRVGTHLAIIVGLVVGVWFWVASTRPADPLKRYPGLGIEGSGVHDVPIGQARGFSFYLLGAKPSSRATVTGVTVPDIPGVRLHVYRVIGPPRGQIVGFQLPNDYPGDPTRAQLEPLVGASLGPVPARLGWKVRGLTAAIVATPITPGCHRITGIAIHYRVGSTTFTRAMDGAISVATGNRDCSASF